MTSTEVRMNWERALTKWEDEDCFPLSQIIEWGFTAQDLFVLCCLHEAGLHRQSIIDLLEDCNFHTECGLLDDRKYDECRELIAKEFNQ